MNTYTEKEAGQKLCCNSVYVRCVASNCMAWVWEPVTKEVRVSGDHGATEINTVIDHEATPTHGRCGLVKGE